MVMFPEVRRYAPEELQSLFKGTEEAGVSPDEQELWLSEVAIEIAKTGARGIDFLLSVIPTADEQRVRASLLAMSLVNRRKLSPRKRRQICELACELLRDRRDMVVAEAVDTLGSLRCEVEQERITPLLNHRSPYVVGSALRFLARRDREKAVPILEEALKSSEPIVRENAVDELDEMGWEQSLAKIKRLLEDPDDDVREAAKTAVENLSKRKK